MNELTMSEQPARATKKQQQLLEFVSSFIAEHEYGPSYREIMNALEYKSVSTVAVHVDGLIAKGFLRRADNSPRSLEVVGREAKADKIKVDSAESELARKANELIAAGAEDSKVETLLGALEILGYSTKVKELRSRMNS